MQDILGNFFSTMVGSNFLLMHDNARPYLARIVQEYLQEACIETLDWPPRSPDLNPIEHLGDSLGRQLRNHQPFAASLDGIENILRNMEQYLPRPDYASDFKYKW